MTIFYFVLDWPHLLCAEYNIQDRYKDGHIQFNSLSKKVVLGTHIGTLCFNLTSKEAGRITTLGQFSQLIEKL